MIGLSRIFNNCCRTYCDIVNRDIRLKTKTRDTRLYCDIAALNYKTERHYLMIETRASQTPECVRTLLP